MQITVAVLGAAVAVVLVVALVLAGAARRTSSLTFQGPVAVRGDVFLLDEDSPHETQWVVRRVLRDLTRSHVALVRPRRWWHRWRWTRAWL